MFNLRSVGHRAEDDAANYLLAQGFTIVKRRCKLRTGEIDLVALDGDILVFVEVKMRRAEGYAPEESIGPTKLKALRAAAAEYIHTMNQEERESRFDFIAMDRDGLRHYRNAFEP